MGNWAIVIQGTGPHHNGKPELDADLLAAKLVAELQRQGHTIESASVTCGGRSDILSVAAQYTAACTVNGVTVTLPAVASYECVVQLARPNQAWGNRVLSVTYRHPAASGILSPGQRVTVRPGMHFDVADTSNA